jgi:luciferase family oxidoreductase group 1
MSNIRKQHPSSTIAPAKASQSASPREEVGQKPLPLSALDLVPLVEGGTSVAALRAAAELAQAVDRFGYTRLWYAEHHNMPGIATTIPEILIAHVGSMTTRIRLGAGGVMLPNHSPLQVAESYKLLEAIYPGRIDLGIGRAPGTDALTALALRRSRKALTADDFLEQLGELIAWDNGTFPPDNPFRAVRAMPDDRPLPPLYLLGSSNSGAELAAEMGVAFAFAGHFSPDSPEVAMHAYRSGFFPTGMLDKPYAILIVFVRRDVTVMQSSKDCAVRKGKFPLAIGFDRYVVAQEGAQTVELACFMGRGNPLPVSVSVRHFGNEVRGSLPVSVPWCRCNEDDKSGYCCKCDEEKREVFHKAPPPRCSGKLKIRSPNYSPSRGGFDAFSRTVAPRAETISRTYGEQQGFRSCV